LRPSNALLIEEATGGAVSRMELLYPTANNKGRGADKPKS
jgi:DNA-binding transcriptional regulator YdaS (Cro superfamily)